MPQMTVEKFWELVHAYDASIFPVQFFFSVLAILLLTAIVKRPSRRLSMMVNLFLAFCYLYIGVVFFLVHNKELSARMRYFQPTLMFIIALFFILDVFQKRSRFRIPATGWQKGMFYFFAAYSIIGYPIVGWLLGHPYSVRMSESFSIWVPILGVYPCPTTIFSLTLLSAALPGADKKVMIPLLFWALFSVMGPPVRLYGVYEDLGLFVAGIYALVMLIVRSREKSD